MSWLCYTFPFCYNGNQKLQSFRNISVAFSIFSPMDVPLAVNGWAWTRSPIQPGVQTWQHFSLTVCVWDDFIQLWENKMEPALARGVDRSYLGTGVLCLGVIALLCGVFNPEAQRQTVVNSTHALIGSEANHGAIRAGLFITHTTWKLNCKEFGSSMEFLLMPKL